VALCIPLVGLPGGARPAAALLQQAGGVLPIEVTVAPSSLLAGGQVSLSGKTGMVAAQGGRSDLITTFRRSTRRREWLVRELG
jgi:hypothetical protein